MFPVGRSEAEGKFWGMPELIEELLLHLNPEATLRLAQAHKMTRDILQGSIVWNNLIRRCSPLNDNRMEKMTHLVAILKLMKDTKDNLLDLIDTICEANAPYMDCEWVQMGCPRHPDSHLISLEGFKLLEEVEAAFGTTEQTVEAISTKDDSFKLRQSDLAPRLSRQQQKLTSVHIGAIVVSNKKEAEDFKVLMQSCPPMASHLAILVAILGAEGWGLLAEGLKSHPGVVGGALTGKESLDGGRKEDLRVLWDALMPTGILDLLTEWDWLEEELYKEDAEAAWIRLCEIRDLSKEEWVAQLEEAEGGDEEDEVEEGREDEDEDEEEGAEEQVFEGEGYEADEEDV